MDTYLTTCLMYSTGFDTSSHGHVSAYMLDVGRRPTPLAAPPAADHILYWCHGLEVYPGSCSDLPPRSLPSHPGNQRSQFTPLIGTGVALRSFCSHLHNPGPCILGGWPLCVEWAFIYRNDYSPGFFLAHSTLVSKLFFLAVEGSGALLSSNLEGVLYKSP